MKDRLKRWIRPAAFTLGGGLAGYLYYYYVGCAGGTCSITSDPLNSVLYMGLMGYLLSGVLCGECTKECKR